MQNTSLCDN